MKAVDARGMAEDLGGMAEDSGGMAESIESPGATRTAKSARTARKLDGAAAAPLPPQGGHLRAQRVQPLNDLPVIGRVRHLRLPLEVDGPVGVEHRRVHLVQ